MCYSLPAGLLCTDGGRPVVGDPHVHVVPSGRSEVGRGSRRSPVAAVPCDHVEPASRADHPGAGPAAGGWRPAVWPLLPWPVQQRGPWRVRVHAPHHLPPPGDSLPGHWVLCPRQHPQRARERPGQVQEAGPADHQDWCLLHSVHSPQCCAAVHPYLRASPAPRLGAELCGQPQLS